MKRALFLASGAATLLLPRSAFAATTLQQRVEQAAHRVGGTLGVYCRTSGADGTPMAALRAEERFPTASTIKVLIMTAVFNREEQNPGTLDDIIVWRRRNLISGSDFMAQAADGQHFRVRELLRPMIQISDNSASNALIGYLGVDFINTIGAAAGMTGTRLARKFLDYSAIVRHQDNLTTPADMATLLDLIATGARAADDQPSDDDATWTQPLVNHEHCRTMVQIMLGQTDRDGIPAGLPAHVPVANKTGAIDGTRNDIAIVTPYGEQPYVLTIYSKEVTDYRSVYAAMRTIAGASFSEVQRQQPSQ